MMIVHKRRLEHNHHHLHNDHQDHQHDHRQHRSTTSAYIMMSNNNNNNNKIKSSTTINTNTNIMPIITFKSITSLAAILTIGIISVSISASSFASHNQNHHHHLNHHNNNDAPAAPLSPIAASISDSSSSAATTTKNNEHQQQVAASSKHSGTSQSDQSSSLGNNHPQPMESSSSSSDSNLALESQVQQQIVQAPSDKIKSTSSSSIYQSQVDQIPQVSKVAASETAEPSSPAGQLTAVDQATNVAPQPQQKQQQQQQVDKQQNLQDNLSSPEYVGIQPEEATPEFVQKLKESSDEPASISSLLDQIDQQESSVQQQQYNGPSLAVSSYNSVNSKPTYNRYRTSSSSSYQPQQQQQKQQQQPHPYANNNNQYNNRQFKAPQPYNQRPRYAPQQAPVVLENAGYAQAKGIAEVAGHASYGPATVTGLKRPPPPPPQQQQQQLDVYARGPPSYPVRAPPQYSSAKMTGLPLGPYPYPAPGHPHQTPRHLPRGAAAGYAAFRKFVRAQAHRYKTPPPPPSPHTQQQPPSDQEAYRSPAVNNHRQPGASNGQYGVATSVDNNNSNNYGSHEEHSPSVEGPAGVSQYKYELQVNHGSGDSNNNKYGPADQYPAQNGPDNSQYQAGKGSNGLVAAKVSTTRAFIPHHLPAALGGGGGAPAASYGGAGHTGAVGGGLGAYQSLLSNLYGNGNKGGKHGISEFGKVVYYPHATIYTEPMNAEQLYKLTGTGIHQILDQLHYSLANGGHDASNTIRDGHKGHHIGNGITIHAKEYHSATPNGGYTTGTAAVIRGPSGSGAGSYQNAGGADNGKSSSVAAAYGVGGVNTKQYADNQGDQGQGAKYPAATASQQTGNYGTTGDEQKQQPGDNIYNGNNNLHEATKATYSSGAADQAASYSNGPSPPISGGSGGGFSTDELLTLYQANSALIKNHLSNPNVQAQLNSYQIPDHLKLKDLHHKQPEFYVDPHHNRNRNHHQQQQAPAPAPMGPHNQQKLYNQIQPSQQPYQHQQQQYRPNNNLVIHHHQSINHHPQQQQQHYHGPQPSGRPFSMNNYRGARQQNYNRQQQQQQYQHQQQQQQQYHIQQQMQQVLHELAVGDDQYNRKAPVLAYNQGYPNHLLGAAQTGGAGYNSNQQNKHQQQQQQQQQQYSGAKSQSADDQLIELPHGPNDQVGEIAELIEALKGTLDAHGGQQQQQSPVMAGDNAYNQAAAAASPVAEPPGTEKLEDVQYLMSTLKQAPSYSMSIPIYHGGREQAGPPAAGQSASNGAGYYGGINAGAAPASDGPAVDLPASNGGATHYNVAVQHQAASGGPASPAGSVNTHGGYEQQSSQHTQPLTSSQYNNGQQQQQQHQTMTGSTTYASGQTGASVSAAAAAVEGPAAGAVSGGGYGQQQVNTLSGANEQQHQQQENYQPLASFVESLPQAFQELMQQSAVVHTGHGGQALTISHDVVLHNPQQQQQHQQQQQQQQQQYQQQVTGAAAVGQQYASLTAPEQHQHQQQQQTQTTY